MFYEYETWITFSLSINFFNFKSNFDQATQKNYKKAILYGKINFKRCQNYSIHMMSQINAPIHGYEKDQKRTHPYFLNENEKENIFYLANEASYNVLELNPVPTRHFELHSKAFRKCFGGGKPRYGGGGGKRMPSPHSSSK